MGCKCLTALAAGENDNPVWVLDLMTVFLRDTPGYSNVFFFLSFTLLPQSTTFHSESTQLQDAMVSEAVFPNVGGFVERQEVPFGC